MPKYIVMESFKLDYRGPSYLVGKSTSQGALTGIFSTWCTNRSQAYVFDSIDEIWEEFDLTNRHEKIRIEPVDEGTAGSSRLICSPDYPDAGWAGHEAKDGGVLLSCYADDHGKPGELIGEIFLQPGDEADGFWASLKALDELTGNYYDRAYSNLVDEYTWER